MSDAPVTTRAETQSRQFRAAMKRRAHQNRAAQQPKWWYLSPLVFAPALPIIRIAFRKNRVLRDRLFFGTIGVALMHGTYLISSSMSGDNDE